MGALVTILCESCGYSEQEHFMRGVGMVGPKSEYDIAPCYNCQVVKQIDISTKTFLVIIVNLHLNHLMKMQIVISAPNAIR